ncbi:hypothetical protein K1718_27395 (plasmid) [Roseibium porphyridii]|uniref:Uncharacterized protein n=1 Tax=Roseibium porphyridii TaxID=2866279 RepID=A0ABY8FB50_9HYPH|nr:hypothetical protein [Roseibium sp. KMA01]WFE92654.1 hypothetical protein K1718_27395 [Roseibium sp. KMA01]
MQKFWVGQLRSFFRYTILIIICTFLGSCMQIPKKYPGDITKDVAQQFLVKPPVGEDWHIFARNHLIHHNDDYPKPEKITARSKSVPRCIKMNNYGCVKHSPENPYFGTKAQNGYDGAHDKDGHAIFSDPKYSIAAKFYWFEKKYKKQGYQTARQLAERYLPWCDTSGSHQYKNDKSGKKWGRTCPDRKSAPASFKGPRCEEPKNGVPKKGQCQACNCPSKRIKVWLNGTNYGPDDKIELFDKQGKPTKLLQIIVTRNAPYEIGYKMKPTLVAEGAKLFVPTR